MSNSKTAGRKKNTQVTRFTGKLRELTGAADRGATIYWVLVAYLCIVALLGGGSRSDLQSLLILRPLAVLACGVAVFTLKREHMRRFRFLFIMSGAIFFMAAIHLVPLPPGVWQALPGREIISRIDSAAGIEGAWRPITLSPLGGWNALYSLFVPLAALLMAVQLDAARLAKLATPLFALAVISGIVGIFQVAGDPNGPLYLYRITNNGSAVGLFANRNHQAVLLVILFPILAFFASQPMKSENAIKLRLVVAIGAAVALIPLILVTGSRLGVILGAVAIVSGWFIYHRPEATGTRRRTERKDYSVLILSFVGFMVLVLTTVLASRAEGLSRLLGTNFGEEERAKAWDIGARLAWENMPIGSGSGSFVPVFQRVEPLDFLSPVYMNRAHNDWLEVWLTFGVPGLILMALALLAFFRGLPSIVSVKGKRPGSNLLLARIGAAIVLFFGLASIADYPLRTPSLACIFVIGCCWMYANLDDKALSTGNLDGN